MPRRLVQKVYNKGNLHAAWRVIQENARSSKSEHVKGEVDAFHGDDQKNIERMNRELRTKTFKFGAAKGIPIPKCGKPVDKSKKAIRPIVLATVEARIVQRAILNVLLGIPGLQPFIANPYSFGGIRKHKEQKLSAVPAAIQAVLGAIADGGRFVACADISGFFKRIPKSTVSAIIAGAVHDDEFMALFEQAITVELANMAELRGLAEQFPIEDIGVAQGNSLSPLLGNILLHDFDHAMNEGDCRCFRYIDDFIIVAPSRRAAIARMRRSREFLAVHAMELSPEKSSIEPIEVHAVPFDFLGIEMATGLIRPAAKAKLRLLENVSTAFKQSKKALRAARDGAPFPKSLSLIATLKRVDGMVQGWGKHYRFCNDEHFFTRVDVQISELMRDYIGEYVNARERLAEVDRQALLGVQELRSIQREAFVWPRVQAPRLPLVA